MLERLGINTASATPSTIMASLSLYLILLAFFIMMNTISQREGSRTEGVIESIGGSFKDYPKTTMIVLEAADRGAGMEDAPGFDKSIEDLFESAFPLAVVEISEPLDRIEVTLPLDSMFTPGGTGVQGRYAPLLDRLADLLEYEITGQIHELEALLSSPPPSHTGESDGDVLLAVNRAGALARELTARGVRAAVIAIGIDRRASDKIRLLFTTRTIDAFDALAIDTP